MPKTTINKLQRFFGFLPKFSLCTSSLVITICVILTIIVAPFLQSAILRDYVNFNLLFAIIGVIIALLLIVIGIKVAKKQCVTFKNFLIIGTIALLIIQLFVFAGYFFVASWDVGRIAFPHDIDNYYYSIYPNNLFIHGIIVRAANLFEKVGFVDLFTNIAQSFFPTAWDKLMELSNTNSEWIKYAINYIFLVFFNILFITSAIVMLAISVCKLLGNVVAKITFSFSAIFTGLMPWILVPYSDTYSLFFVTLIFFSYVCIKNKYLKATLITFATIIGFNIKPTVIFALLALLFVEICLLIKKYASKKGLKEFSDSYLSVAKKSLKTTSISAICIVLTGVICISFTGVIKDCNIDIDKNKEYTSTHFLMMGLDPVTRGLYAQKFIDISDSANSVEEREQLNKEQIQNSLQTLGLAGLLQLIGEKLTITFSDGTLSWHQDNGPNFMQFQVTNLKAIEFAYDNYGPIAQVMWYLLLIGVCILPLFKKNRNNKHAALLATTILLITIFLSLFECGARYLIIYTPYITITAAYGWKELGLFIKHRQLRRL